MNIVQTFVIDVHVHEPCDWPNGQWCKDNCVKRQRLFISGPFGKAEWHEGSKWWSFTSVDGVTGANHVNGKPLDEETAVRWCAMGMEE